MSDSEQPVVLIVEDEPDLAELYERWLASDYTVTGLKQVKKHSLSSLRV